jgi:small subunit ribosomal protein S21
MIIVKVEGSNGIEKALKKYKSRFVKHRIMDEIKSRTEYIKESFRKRDELSKAIYRESKRRDQI